MKIEKFVLGPVGTNCYIVRNEDTMECFIVDLWQPALRNW